MLAVLVGPFASLPTLSRTEPHLCAILVPHEFYYRCCNPSSIVIRLSATCRCLHSIEYAHLLEIANCSVSAVARPILSSTQYCCLFRVYLLEESARDCLVTQRPGDTPRKSSKKKFREQIHRVDRFPLDFRAFPDFRASFSNFFLRTVFFFLSFLPFSFFPPFPPTGTKTGLRARGLPRVAVKCDY